MVRVNHNILEKMNVYFKKTIKLCVLSFAFISSLQAHKEILIFMGAPGAGKGTLVENCCNQLNFKVLSTGNLCRQEIVSGSLLGKKIEHYSLTTGMTPDDIIADMVEGWLEKQSSGTEKIIFDGYPRTQAQAKRRSVFLEEKLPDYCLRIIYLEAVDSQELIERILSRRVCVNKKCQAVYNRMIESHRDIIFCEKCKSRLVQRADDTEEIVRTRIAGFFDNIIEILSYYEGEGILINKISVSHIEPQNVFTEFQRYMHLF